MGLTQGKPLVLFGKFTEIKVSPQSLCSKLGRIKCTPMRQTAYSLSKMMPLSKFPA
jgi:hypothetical protein